MSLPSPRAFHGLIDFAQQHRLALVASAAALLAGSAITAVAVAPLASDAVTPPQRLVVDSVVPEGLDAQLAALSTQDFDLARNDITRGTDSAESLLARLGVHDPAAAAYIRGNATARQLLAGRGGKMVQARSDATGALEELVARFPSDQADTAKTHFVRLTIRRAGGQWQSRMQTVPYAAETRLASGTVATSLYAATDEAGLPDAVATQIAEIFATDIDFHRELRRGDSFSVVYETLTADGEPVAWNEGAGRVLAAEFVNAGQAHHAVWFTGADGKGAYYDIDGRSKKRGFLASPMEFSRVTSGFALRFHPLLQNWRQHKGVDYGAPTGTPVRVVGDGVVDFAGWQSGYGNVVQVRHSGDRSTLYAHLSHIDVKKGQHLDQGQRVGAVGATGWATGPHLHFEFRVAGEHQDPLRIAKATETLPVEPGSRAHFAATVRAVQAKLDVAETLVSQRTRVE